MQTKKYWAAMRRFTEAKGSHEARQLLVEAGLGWSTAQKVVRRNYRLTPNGKVFSAIKPLLLPYMDGAE